MWCQRSRVLVVACLCVGVVSWGCDDNGRQNRAHPLGPSPITFNPFPPASPVNSIDFFARGVTFQPSVLNALTVPGANCPFRPPHIAPVRIVATGGQSDTFLNRVDMRLVDRRGVAGGSLTVSQSQLTEQFGSNRIPPLGHREFPFSFPFGCVGGGVGTLGIVVVAADAFGNEFTRSFSTAIR